MPVWQFFFSHIILAILLCILNCPNILSDSVGYLEETKGNNSSLGFTGLIENFSVTPNYKPLEEQFAPANSFIRESIQGTHDRHAYVTLLYGSSYLLPVRVMMQSLRVNSPDNFRKIVLVTSDVSENAIAQLHSEGIETRKISSVNNPYAKDSKYDARFDEVMAKLTIFNMTDLDSVVYIDADSLVFGPLGDLFHCADFCAAFINPCLFNSGVMALKPSRTVFEDMMQKLPILPSYDGGDQGFLNSYFSSLYYAPVFDPSSENGTGGPLRRLPFGWHLDHILFYPRFRWEIPEKPCGSMKIVEFLGGPFLKPWKWWSYLICDLSYVWLEYRMQLKFPYPPGYMTGWGIFLRCVCIYLLAFVGIISLKKRYAYPRILVTKFIDMLWSYMPFREEILWIVMELIHDRAFLLFCLGLGFFLWVLTTAVSCMLIPVMLPPWRAAILYLHYKALLFGYSLILFGLFCSSHAKSSDFLKWKGKPFTVWMESFVWIGIETFFAPVGFYVFWHIPWKTAFQKALYGLFTIGFYLCVIAFMFCRVSFLWLRWGAARYEAQRARARSLPLDEGSNNWNVDITDSRFKVSEPSTSLYVSPVMSSFQENARKRAAESRSPYKTQQS
ncbi:Putative glucuronosyltransferase PGSIP7 [Galdieria sulphuraria]|nr:Putative glucuronosyltransferase PGSIP7 [Galdieria sulphuraria]